MSKTSFVLSYDFRDIFINLSSEQKANLIDAIFDYEIDGKYKKLDGLLKVVFIPIKQYLDKNKEKYNSICQRNAGNGASGGRPKNNPENPVGCLGTQNNPEKPKKADSELELELELDNENIIKENKQRKVDAQKPERLFNGKPLSFFYRKVPFTWNSVFADAPNVPQVRVEKLSKNVMRVIKCRLADEFPSLEEFGDYFDYLRASSFLCDRCTAIDFCWILKPENLRKALQGNYHKEEKLNFDKYMKFKKEENNEKA